MRTSLTTTTLSTTDVPGHGDFIIASSPLNDWRNPQNDNLWQGAARINNPCPASFRLPTLAEWETERLSWSSNNAAGAFASPLKLVAAGFRSLSSGRRYNVDSIGYYWSSTVSGIFSRYLYFNGTSASMSSNYRANGLTVRCIKD